MQKTVLASAITMSFYCASANAVVPSELLITNMQFNGIVYSAGGQFNQTGTLGSFDPNTDLVPDPNPPLGAGGRMPAPGFDQAVASGYIFSFDHFFNNPWEGIQQTPYLTNADSFAFVYDHATSDCSAPTNVTKSSGPCSDLGSYDYDTELAAMDVEQVAVGMFFNWNNNDGIPVLEIFDCDAGGNCKGNGVAMATPPFAGAVPLFNAGLSCQGGFSTTGVDTPVSISIAGDVLGTDVPPANCFNPTATTPDNPEGLKVDGVVSPTANGGTAVINGTDIDYTPMGGFEGSDSFIVNVSDDTTDTSSISYVIQVGGALQNNFSMMDRAGNIFGGTNDVDIVWDEVSFNDSTLDGNGSPTDTNFGLMTIASPEPFFNFTWTAHHVRIFNNTTGAPVTYNFDVTCRGADYDAGTVDCDKPLAEQGALTRFITMTLEPGEIGGHILFDWGKDDNSTPCGKANCDIDVVNKWSAGMWDKHGATGNKNVIWIGPAGVPPATVENSGEGNQANWVLVSGDVNGDGINASPMIDGAFEGSYANFNYKPDKAGTALPPYEGQISDVNVDGFSFSLWTLFAGILSVVGLRRFAGQQTASKQRAGNK